MLAAVGVAKAIFVTNITGTPKACIKALRTAVIQTAIGHKKPHSAPELITTLILEASRSDLGIASDQAAIMTVKRLIERDPGALETINEVRALREGM